MKVLNKIWRDKGWVIGLSFIIYHLSFSPAGAQTLLSEYQPGVTQEGAIYRLPKTAVAVTVRAVKTTYTPGDFAKYAQRYLRLNNVSTEPSTKNEVISVQQTAFAIADTTKTYAVKFDSRTVAANIQLSEDGCLLGINSPSSLPLPEVRGVYSTGGNYSLPVREGAASARQYLTEEILAAGSTAKMAELTAQEIYDIRENRNLLIKGQADFMPKDGEQLKLMLNQLQRQDESLTSLFAGTIRRDTTERTFIVCPAKPVDRQVLFRFSQLRGLVDADDLSGVPYYINVEDLKTVPSLVVDAAAKKKQKPSEKGIYVNVPSKMRVTILQGNDLVDTAEHPAPQFGHVELLSDQLFNKRYTTHLLLNPVSGAVDRLEAELPKK